MDLSKLLKTSLKNFSPYEPGEQPTGEGWIKLNTNENPFPPIKEIMEDIKSAVNDKIRLYPDPTAFEVRKMILSVLLRDEKTLTNRNSIFIGNGSDELLEIIFKAFVNPKDVIVLFYPTYGMYKVLADLYNAKINLIKLREDFSFPESVYNAEGKLMLISSPNNPNGKSFENAEILEVCKNFPGIVVVDEAYADFSEITALPLLKQVNNLIIVRTFSKSFSLASLRLAYALGDPILIKEMNKIKLPFNTNYLAQIAALSCIRHKDKIFEQNRKIIEERQRLTEELSKYKVSILPSDANFILIKFQDKSEALKLFWALKEKKILVRHFAKPGLYPFIRVTVGTHDQNNKFLQEFKKLQIKIFKN